MGTASLTTEVTPLKTWSVRILIAALISVAAVIVAVLTLGETVVTEFGVVPPPTEECPAFDTNGVCLLVPNPQN